MVTYNTTSKKLSIKANLTDYMGNLVVGTNKICIKVNEKSIMDENNQIIQRKIYVDDVPYPLNNGYHYQSKNGQAIHQKVEDNNIRNNIKSNKNTYSNYTNQREYSDEFLNSLYANL